MPVKHNTTVPIKRTVPSTLKVLQKMENPKGNPLLAAIKQFADNPQKLQESLEKLLNEGQEKVCEYLLDIMAMYNKNTAKHMKGVARIAAKFIKEKGEKIGLNAQEKKVTIIAARIHDFGKRFTPLKFLTKPGKLTPMQKKSVDKHALRTKQFLEQSGLIKDEFFKTAADLAEKHHTSVDKLNMTKKRTIEEEILELSDVFSALTMKRDYKRPMHPKEALKLMQETQEKEKLWNPNIFKEFKDCYGK